MDQAGPIDLMPLVYLLGAYLALQLLLNLGGRLILQQLKASLWQALVVTFWFGVANAVYFVAAAAVMLGRGYAPPPPGLLPPSPWWTLAGLPLGVMLWVLTVLGRKLGAQLFGRGEIVAAEDAILRLPPERAYLALGTLNLALLQPLGRELFMRGVFLPAVVADLGWLWALLATLLVEFMLRLNVTWIVMTSIYVAVMYLLYYLTGAPWCGLTAACIAGLLHAVALLAMSLKSSERVRAQVQRPDQLTNASKTEDKDHPPHD